MITTLQLQNQSEFAVFIDGFKRATFAECTELKAELGVREYREGGYVIAHKEPGHLKFNSLTLKRGVTEDQDFYVWFSLVVQLTAAGNGAKAIGLSNGLYKKTIDIVQLDRAGVELGRWTVVNCWPKTFTAGKWDGKSEDHVVEELELEYDYFDKSL